MALPSTGAITMAQVAAELGVSQTGINLNQSNVRTLAGKPSGAIGMSDLRGKSNGGASITIGTYYDGTARNYGYATSAQSAVPYGSMSPNNQLTAAPGAVMRAFFWYELYSLYAIGVTAASGAPFTPKAAYDVIIGGTSYRGAASSDGTSIGVSISLAQYNALPKSGTVAVNAVKV